MSACDTGTTQGKGTPAVVAVVVHYRVAEATLSCLRRLGEQGSPAHIIVVNNAYPDEERGWPRVQAAAAAAGAEVLDAGSNTGFTGGSNLGIRRAMALGAEFVWLVNPDAEPERDALGALLGRIRSDDRLGAVGSRLLSEGPEQPGGTVSLARGLAHACVSEAYDFISGASLLLRTSALREAGLFDDRLFLYWEDVDLCLRLRGAGWGLGVEPGSRVAHRGGGAVGPGSPTQDYYAARNALLVSRRHAPLTFPLAAALVLGRVTVGKLVRLEGRRLGAALEGWWDGVRGRGGMRGCGDAGGQ